MTSKPEEESVERIEIEGVKWSDEMEDNEVGGTYTGILWTDEPYKELRKLKLAKRVPMKMILEIPKEE